MKNFFHQFASPKSYFRIATKIQNPFLLIFVLLYIFALAWGLLFTPEDYVQGNSYRIIFMHVPASFVSQILFLIPSMFDLVAEILCCELKAAQISMIKSWLVS